MCQTTCCHYVLKLGHLSKTGLYWGSGSLYSLFSELLVSRGVVCFFLLKSEGDSHRQNMDTLLGTLCSYCLSSSWHNFRNGLETFWSVWTHHHAVAFVDCKLYQGGTNLAWDLVDAEAIWVQCIHCHVQDDFSFETWRVIMLEAGIIRWVHCPQDRGPR